MQNFLKETKDKRDFFLMDLSWHIYRSYYTFIELSCKGRLTGHIYGVLRTVSDIKRRSRDAVTVLCRDGKPQDRITINAEMESNYKEGRIRPKDNLMQDTDTIIKFAYLTPDVYMAYNEHKEADDSLYKMAKEIEASNPNAHIYIYTADDDLLQAISDRICVLKKFTSKADEPLEVVDKFSYTNNMKMLEKYKGCPPDKLPIYRAIVGDKSDNLPGIPRFPKQLAAAIARHVNSIPEIMKLQLHGLSIAQRKKMNELIYNISLIENNYKMMKLGTDFELEIKRKYYTVDEFNRIRVELKKLGLNYYDNFLIAIGNNNKLLLNL